MVNYTAIGKDYGKEAINKAIERTEWENFRTTYLPFMQGEAIKQIIQVCKIPLKGIKRMALHNVIAKGGEEHGFYALDVNYSNGKVKVYVADSGCGVCVVATDFEAFN